MKIETSIGKEKYYLPMEDQELFRIVQEQFGDPKYLLNKKGFHKIYPIDCVDSCSFLNKVNIFLLNMVLLIDQLNEERFSITESTSNDQLLENLINQIGYELSDNQTFDKLSRKEFQEIENEVIKLCEIGKERETVDFSTKSKRTRQKEIDFSIEWVKEKDNEIKRKENEDDQYFGIH